MSRQIVMNRRYEYELQQKEDNIRLLNDQLRQLKELNNRNGLSISVRNKSEFCFCILFYDDLY